MKRVALTVAIVLGVSACGVAGARAGGSGDMDAAKGRESAASVSPQPSASRSAWIDSLQMISASSGWALLWTANPNSSSALQVARTGDGGRTWILNTPASARAALSAGQSLLYVMSAQRAWVVGVIGGSSVVFGTADGGRSWWRSGSVPAADPVAVDFAGHNHGWLLESMGAAMSQNPVRLYGSSDGGRSWSLVARSAQMPGDPPSGSGLPVPCDKTAVTFSPASSTASSIGTGWITGYCPTLTGAVLVSRDGGAHWANPQLPIPPSACQQDGCQIAEPQFAGRTTFLLLCAYPDQALLLTTTDGGADWRTIIMPAGAGPYPRVHFFGSADGIAVSAGPQGSVGRVFYLTADGGRTWTPVAQGTRFGQSGASFDFVTPAVGFAWLSGTGSTGASPVMYETSSSGRSWASFAPRLG